MPSPPLPPPAALTPAALPALFPAILPTAPPDVRAQATLALAAHASAVRSAAGNPNPPPSTSTSTSGDEPDAATRSLVLLFSPPLVDRLSATDAQHAREGLAFLSALFTVDPLAAAALLARDDVAGHLADLPEIFSAPPTTLSITATTTTSSSSSDPNQAVHLALANLLAQAAGVKQCRAVLTDHWLDWLQRAAGTGSEGVRTKAGLALLKLSRGADGVGNGSAGEGGGEVDVGVTEEMEVGLAGRMAAALIRAVEAIPATGGGEEQLDVLETLAHLSLTPAIRESLSTNAPFLHALFALSRPQTDAAASLPRLYGISVIISNVLAYRPKLAGEAAQLDRLRRMAKGGLGKSGSATGGPSKLKDEPVPPLERDAAVLARCRRLLRAGVAPCLVALARAGGESAGVRECVGRAFLSLVEHKEARGAVVQAGGARALQSIIRASLAQSSTAPSSSTSTAPPDVSVLPAIQALAKLAITSSPLLLFGPTPSASYDAIRPLVLLLTHPSASLLQQFESLMALTNLASLGPDLSTRIAAHTQPPPGLLPALDSLLLDDNTLVRRAAAELTCNLVSAPAVFARYTAAPGAQGRLHVLLALSDVADLPTRQAASGALAMLTADSPEACAALLTLPKGAEHTLNMVVQLIDPSLAPRIIELDTSDPTTSESDLASTDSRPDEPPDAGLQHRGTLLLRNLLLNPAPPTDAKAAERAGAVKALVGVVRAFGGRQGGEDVLRAAAEALRWFVQRGVQIGD